MRINGEWYPCSDGIIGPVIRGEVLGGNGAWLPAHFLVDTGADRTVLIQEVLRLLGLQPLLASDRLGGVGGAADSVVVETPIRFTRDNGGEAIFHGRFAALTRPSDLDMSVLGRDITDLFALIVDRPADVVCLLGQRHSYRIEQS